MISLNDSQLATVMTAAADLPQEKRSIFLERIGAMLAIRGHDHFNDDDVADVAWHSKVWRINRRVTGVRAT